MSNQNQQNMAVAFRDKLAFCSNFYHHQFIYKDLIFRTSEHAFQWAKCKNESDKIKILEATTPSEAKKIGKTVELIDDWDVVRLGIMYEILKCKFDIHNSPVLATELILTGDQELVEHNTWHDYFWGKCNGQGENWLGKILMRIRDELNDKFITK